MTDETHPRPKGAFAATLAQLKAQGLAPPPAFESEDTLPMSLSTREDLAVWCAANGYPEDATKLLDRAVRSRVYGSNYLEALAADLSQRFDLNGVATGYVELEARLSASLQLHARAMKSGLKALQAPAPKPAPQNSPPSPSPMSPKPNPFRSGGPLSAGEIARRQQALAALKKVAL